MPACCLNKVIVLNVFEHNLHFNLNLPLQTCNFLSIGVLNTFLQPSHLILCNLCNTNENYNNFFYTFK